MARIEIEESEAIAMFRLMEKLNQFFHQPLNFESKSQVQEFAQGVYPEIHRAYYEVTWNWLPPEERERIESQ